MTICGVSALDLYFKKWERKRAHEVYGGIRRACRLGLCPAMKSWFDNSGWNGPAGFSRTPGRFSQKCHKPRDWTDRCATEPAVVPIKAAEPFVLADTFQTQFRKGEFGELALEWSPEGPFWLRMWAINKSPLWDTLPSPRYWSPGHPWGAIPNR